MTILLKCFKARLSTFYESMNLKKPYSIIKGKS